MNEIEKITVNEMFIDGEIKKFITGNKRNSFYDKNVFFTRKLKSQKYKYFQIIGNLGGFPTETDFSLSTDFYIISDLLFEELKQGFIDEQLIELEKKLNAKGKKYTQLKVLTENVFLNYIKERCLEINDQVTLKLIP